MKRDPVIIKMSRAFINNCDNISEIDLNLVVFMATRDGEVLVISYSSCRNQFYYTYFDKDDGRFLYASVCSGRRMIETTRNKAWNDGWLISVDKVGNIGNFLPMTSMS